MTTPRFRTSTRCSKGGCAEVAHRADGGVIIRSTQRPHEFIVLDAGEWADFRAAISAGEFDRA